MLDNNDNIKEEVKPSVAPEPIYRIGGPVKRPDPVDIPTDELLKMFYKDEPAVAPVTVEQAVPAPKADSIVEVNNTISQSKNLDIIKLARAAAMSNENVEVDLGAAFDPDVAINPSVAKEGVSVYVPEQVKTTAPNTASNAVPVEEDFGNDLFSNTTAVVTSKEEEVIPLVKEAEKEEVPIKIAQQEESKPIIDDTIQAVEKVETVTIPTADEEDEPNITVWSADDNNVEDKSENMDSVFNNDMFSLTDLDLISDKKTPPLVIPLQRQEVIKASVLTSSPKIMHTLASEEEDGDARDKLSDFASRLDNVISDEHSYLHRLHYADAITGNNATLEKNEALEQLFAGENKAKTSKDFQNSVVVDNVRYTDGVVKKESVLRSFKDGDIVSSKSSLQVMMALMQGIRKVYFYGSGFWVAIRAPMLGELQQIRNEIDFMSGEYGRILGGYTYLPETVEVSAGLVKLFHSLISKSNLEGYTDLDTFKKALSFVDYDIIPWAMATLMYPKGVAIEFLCHHEDCRYTEVNTIDIDRMRFNNWSILSSDAIKFTVSSEVRSVEDLTEYRKKYLPKNEKVIKLTEDDWVINLRVPTFDEYEKGARNYIGEMMKIITDVNATKSEDYQTANYFKTFVPFVRNIRYQDKTSGKSIIFDNTSSNLSAVLDTLQLQMVSTNLANEITVFLGYTKISHICYTFNTCPKCGKQQSAGVCDLIACDPEMTFFILAANRAIAEKK